MASRIHDDLPPGIPPVTYAPREPRLRRPPFPFIAIAIIAVVGSWVPLVLFARGRVSRSELPRVQLPQDMGSQPKYREQQTSELFVDGRADRPRVVGTVARGKLYEDDHLYRGYQMTGGGQGGKPQVKFFDDFPPQMKVDEALLHRGRERFTIYCSACHGDDGYGHGSVSTRADEIGMPINAASFHTDVVRNRPNGHIFNTITNGIRTMPAYSAQIAAEDRWAIVAYVRALELSQNVPPNMATAAASDAKPDANAAQASSSTSAAAAGR
jgi:mono/diheme cytochrome c family protein